MDKKKTLITSALLMLAMTFASALNAFAQEVKVDTLKFIDKHIEYKAGNDTVTVFFKLYDEYNTVLDTFTPEDLKEHITILENGEEIEEAKIARKELHAISGFLRATPSLYSSTRASRPRV